MASPSVHLCSIHLSANEYDANIIVTFAFMREEYIDPRCRVPPNTMPSENDKEEAPHALPDPAARSGKLQIDGVRILFKFTRQRERTRAGERENERRNATQICNFKIFQ